MRRKIIPPLAKALKPLHPQAHELEAVLGELKRSGSKMGQKLRMDDLQAGLAAFVSVP